MGLGDWECRGWRQIEVLNGVVRGGLLEKVRYEGRIKKVSTDSKTRGCVLIHGGAAFQVKVAARMMVPKWENSGKPWWLDLSEPAGTGKEWWVPDPLGLVSKMGNYWWVSSLSDLLSCCCVDVEVKGSSVEAERPVRKFLQRFPWEMVASSSGVGQRRWWDGEKCLGSGSILKVDPIEFPHQWVKPLGGKNYHELWRKVLLLLKPGYLYFLHLKHCVINFHPKYFLIGKKNHTVF